MPPALNGLRPRFGSPDRICYLLLAGTREPPTPHVPQTLSRGYLELLQMMPKATRQFIDPIGWHEKAISVGSFRHYDFGIAYDDVPSGWIEEHLQRPLLSVIFLQTTSTSLWDKIAARRNKCLILTLDADIGGVIANNSDLKDIYCSSIKNYFEKLTQRVAALAKKKPTEIDEALAKRVKSLKRDLDKHQARFAADFRACRPNDHSFLQLIAPYGKEVLENEVVTHRKRPEALVASAERVLNAFALVTAAGRKAQLSARPFTPPLILTWPYYGPNLKELFELAMGEQEGEDRNLLKVIKEVAFEEQDPGTYDVPLRTRRSDDVAAILFAISEFKVKMTAFLDSVSYLHASFQDSPVLRMPLTGKSINEALGSFQKSCTSAGCSTKRVGERLKRCGDLLGSRFPVGFMAHIDRCYDQIVAVTDIPIEWTIFDGVPLAFMVDICRLPQSSPSSIMAQFTSNALAGYSVKSDILKRTLVICGAEPTDPIGILFDNFVAGLDESGEFSPRAVRCSSKAEFAAAIANYKPDLLIFDGHGNFTQDEGSYLSVGQEKILGGDIAALKPAVPLVVLSCCLSAPLYGCINTIAQAFFEAGSRSVLCTFLPISVNLGYLLYHRILGNLTQAVHTSYHRNWLSFISHNLRTSHFDDYLNMLRSALDEDVDQDRYREHRTHWAVDSINPSKRREVYLRTPDAAINCFRETRHGEARAALKLRHLVPEAFYYTHLGRADLVQFDVALADHVGRESNSKKLYEEIAANWSL